MALSSENAGRRPRRLTRPTVPPPLSAAPTPAPPSILAPPADTPAASVPLPLPSPPDASEVQSIPLVPGASAAPDPLPAPSLPGDMPAARADATVPDIPVLDAPDGLKRRKPAASPVPDGAPAPAPRARNLRWVWLAVLLLLLVLVGALAYLLWPAARVPDRGTRTVAGPFAAARARVAGWFGRERSAVTNLPAPGAAAPAETASPLSRPIRQALQVVGAVEAVREDLPPELMTRAAEDGTATATLPSSAASAVVAAPPPEPVPPAAPEVAPEPVAPAAVEWPDVEVSAVVGSGRRGSAIINGQVMVIGEESEEGLQLERIEPQAAVLRYRGATRRFIVRKR